METTSVLIKRASITEVSDTEWTITPLLPPQQTSRAANLQKHHMMVCSDLLILLTSYELYAGPCFKLMMRIVTFCLQTCPDRQTFFISHVFCFLMSFSQSQIPSEYVINCYTCVHMATEPAELWSFFRGTKINILCYTAKKEVWSRTEEEMKEVWSRRKFKVFV